MKNLILIIMIMMVGIYFRVNFDKKYVIPVMKSNKDLSFLNKLCIGALVIAIICLINNLREIGFWILIILIPFVLYLNFKTYWIAIINFFKKD